MKKATIRASRSDPVRASACRVKRNVVPKLSRAADKIVRGWRRRPHGLESETSQTTVRLLIIITPLHLDIIKLLENDQGSYRIRSPRMIRSFAQSDDISKHRRVGTFLASELRRGVTGLSGHKVVSPMS